MSELLQSLAAQLGQKISKKYRVPAESAQTMVLQYWAQKADLLKIIETATSEKAVTRTRVYKDAERDATRKVYYELRRYQSEQNIDQMLQEFEKANDEAREDIRRKLIENHVSTAERTPHLDEFWQTLGQLWGHPSSLLDVGCGLLPLVFPYGGVPLERYTALDRSQDSIRTIETYKKLYNRTALEAKVWSIGDGWTRGVPANQTYDVALMLKLVPVVARQEPESLAILAQVPARKIIITGCKTAMVKQQDISRRERTIILQFAQDFNLQLLHEFETPDEVGFVFEK